KEWINRSTDLIGEPVRRLRRKNNKAMALGDPIVIGVYKFLVSLLIPPRYGRVKALSDVRFFIRT
ncbi:MAG TPA: hypothetical protein VMW75_01480, partial [Thermoanaerobaculia bacterium]|nr:hypothetical protein [Thermoanaerobaculia bacterium]